MTIINNGLTEHPLAKFGARLVSDDQTVREALNDYYGAVYVALDDFADALDKAGKVDPDLKDTARAERQHKLVDAAKRKLNNVLAQETQALNLTVAGLHSEIQEQARPKTPDDPTERLLAYLQRRDDLADLRAMSGEDRAMILHRTASAGDRRIIDALSMSLTPLVHPPLIDSALETYVSATQAPAVQRLEIVEHVVASAKTTARLAQGKAETLTAQAKLLPKPADMAFQSPAKDMTATEKTAFIGAHGLDRWQQFVKGDWTPPVDPVE